MFGTTKAPLSDLFEEYQLTKVQRQICHSMKKRLRNNGAELDDDEELIWAVALETRNMGRSPKRSEMEAFEQRIEEQLDSRENDFGWMSYHSAISLNF